MIVKFEVDTDKDPNETLIQLTKAHDMAMCLYRIDQAFKEVDKCTDLGSPYRQPTVTKSNIDDILGRYGIVLDDLIS